MNGGLDAVPVEIGLEGAAVDQVQVARVVEGRRVIAHLDEKNTSTAV